MQITTGLGKFFHSLVKSLMLGEYCIVFEPLFTQEAQASYLGDLASYKKECLGICILLECLKVIFVFSSTPFDICFPALCRCSSV